MYIIKNNNSILFRQIKKKSYGVSRYINGLVKLVLNEDPLAAMNTSLKRK